MSDHTSILRLVSASHRLTVKEVTSGSKCRRVRLARNEAAYRMYQDTELSVSEIARLLGLRVRTTVEYGIKKHADRIGKPLRRITELRDVAKTRAIDYEKFGYLVAAWLLRENITQQRAGDLAGVSRTSIVKATQGQGLDADTFLLIRDAAGLEEAEFRLPFSRETVTKQLPQFNGEAAHA